MQIHANNLYRTLLGKHKKYKMKYGVETEPSPWHDFILELFIKIVIRRRFVCLKLETVFEEGNLNKEQSVEVALQYIYFFKQNGLSQIRWKPAGSRI